MRRFRQAWRYIDRSRFDRTESRGSQLPKGSVDPSLPQSPPQAFLEIHGAQCCHAPSQRGISFSLDLPAMSSYRPVLPDTMGLSRHLLQGFDVLDLGRTHGLHPTSRPAHLQAILT
jgi:hypothetical protein